LADDSPPQVSPSPDAAPRSAPDTTADIAGLKEQVAELSRRTSTAPTSFGEFCYGFPNSGLFYILLGMFFLLVANWRMETTHASFTFVLVVLGVAVLLYGTGTQSAGNFTSDATAAKYNVAIAGGAGILALCVAFGMVKFAPEMANAFQVEQRYLRVLIRSSDGSSKIGQYTARFSTDGIPIPSVLRSNSYVEVFVPYTLSDLASLKSDTAAPAGSGVKASQPAQIAEIGCTAELLTADLASDDEPHSRKTISGEFYRVPTSRDPLDPKFDRLRDMVAQNFVIKLSKYNFAQNSAGRDFPEYGEKICINLQNDEQPKAIQSSTRAISNLNAFNIGSAPVAAGQPTLSEPAELVIK
jgi:hypothetical protein